jgi:hypothetical protein
MEINTEHNSQRITAESTNHIDILLGPEEYIMITGVHSKYTLSIVESVKGICITTWDETDTIIDTIEYPTKRNSI